MLKKNFYEFNEHECSYGSQVLFKKRFIQKKKLFDSKPKAFNKKLDYLFENVESSENNNKPIINLEKRFYYSTVLTKAPTQVETERTRNILKK